MKKKVFKCIHKFCWTVLTSINYLYTAQILHGEMFNIWLHGQQNTPLLKTTKVGRKMVLGTGLTVLLVSVFWMQLGLSMPQTHLIGNTFLKNTFATSSQISLLIYLSTFYSEVKHTRKWKKMSRDALLFGRLINPMLTSHLYSKILLSYPSWLFPRKGLLLQNTFTALPW